MTSIPATISWLLLLLYLDNPTLLVAAENQCFANHEELKTAVDQYTNEDCAKNNGCNVSQTHGWPMNSWCMPKVTDMSQLFSQLYLDFNEDISAWDVSNVTNMEGMFNGAEAFNGDLSAWDVSSVTNMEDMFRDASSFNQNISSWDTSSVTSMQHMFLEASSFNQDLCAWDEKFPYGSNSVNLIFLRSGCTFQDEPQLEQRGPFCASSCNTTLSSDSGPSTSSTPSPTPKLPATSQSIRFAPSSLVFFLGFCALDYLIWQ